MYDVSNGSVTGTTFKSWFGMIQTVLFGCCLILDMTDIKNNFIFASPRRFGTSTAAPLDPTA